MLGQKVCLNEILNEFLIGSRGVQGMSLGQTLGNPCEHARGYMPDMRLLKA